MYVHCKIVRSLAMNFHFEIQGARVLIDNAIFFIDYCFVHPIFGFWSLLATKLQSMKILSNLCLHFARQDGQDGQDWKNPERKSSN